MKGFPNPFTALHLILLVAAALFLGSCAEMVPMIFSLEEGEDLDSFEDKITISIPVILETAPEETVIPLPRPYLPPIDYRALYAKDNWDVAALDTGRDAEYLSQAEKDILLVMNIVRSDPARFAELYISPVPGYYQENAIEFPGELPFPTEEGAAAAVELYKKMILLQPSPLLQPSSGMSRAARDHTTNLRNRELLSPLGTDGSTPSRRLQRYGAWQDHYGENRGYGRRTCHRIILQMLIDDGNPTRLQRKNILDGRFTYCGISLQTHPRLKHTVVINFAADYSEIKSGNDARTTGNLFQNDSW